MANLNRVFLIGNLTRDPEIRYIPSGKAVADLQLAVNRRYKTRSGEDREDTCFIGVVVWERQAEAAGKYLKKGSSVLVEGSLQFDQWETNGEKRSRIRVNASRIQFLDRLKRSEFGDAPEDKTDADHGGGEPPSGDSKGTEPVPDESPSADGPVDEKSDADDLPF